MSTMSPPPTFSPAPDSLPRGLQRSPGDRQGSSHELGGRPPPGDPPGSGARQPALARRCAPGLAAARPPLTARRRGLTPGRPIRAGVAYGCAAPAGMRVERTCRTSGCGEWTPVWRCCLIRDGSERSTRLHGDRTATGDSHHERWRDRPLAPSVGLKPGIVAFSAPSIGAQPHGRGLNRPSTCSGC